jgi:hypothetical protein
MKVFDHCHLFTTATCQRYGQVEDLQRGIDMCSIYLEAVDFK